jgi:hypothetical protein
MIPLVEGLEEQADVAGDEGNQRHDDRGEHENGGSPDQESDAGAVPPGGGAHAYSPAALRRCSKV